MATASERFPLAARLARSPLLWIAVMVILGCMMRVVRTSDDRGVRLLAAVDPRVMTNVKPGETAALFVGVQHFTSVPPPAEVEYAVDDAVDLASVFAERLVEPARIVLVLAGEPHKKISQERLASLVADGATVTEATRETIERTLQQQADLAGKDGELIVSFATHGFSTDGVHHVLASDSSFEDRDSAISTAMVLDIAARAGRSIIFLDACRNRTSSTRGGSHRVDSRAPLLSRMKKVSGQVVFAPAAGRVTNEDFQKRNGVFTGTILAGLEGGAACGPDGYVTVNTLRDFVEARMMRWLRRQDPNESAPAIQVNTDGNSGQLPLAECDSGQEIGRLDPTDHSIDVFDTAGKHLWGHHFDDTVIGAKFAEPDNTVVVAAGSRILAFDSEGHDLWTADAGEGMSVKTLLVDKLLHGVRGDQIGVLATGAEGSRIMIWERNGKLRGTYRHPSRLLTLFVTHLTARHAAKLVAASATDVFMLDPKDVSQLWDGKVSPADRIIRGVSTDDPNHDGNLDIAVKLAGGDRLYLDFEGHRIPTDDSGGAHFELIAPP